jgi:hypothetical protein
MVLFFAAPLVRPQSADAMLNLPDDPSVNQQQGAVQQSPTASADGSAASKALPTTQGQTAAEQLKQQEQQRILGVMATFNTTQNKDALTLSPAQKFQLFFKSVTDPWPFVLTAFVTGIDVAQDSNPEYGHGVEGFAKQYGASYTDYFTGNFFGNAVLPSLLHEDPRYFQKGTGSIAGRALWAAASTGWCKRDNGKWGPNYANVTGNLIGAAISNAYYPAAQRTVSDTIERGITVTAEGAVGAELIEFWPDIERHYKKKRTERLARKAAQRNAQSVSQPAAEIPAHHSNNF